MNDPCAPLLAGSAVYRRVRITDTTGAPADPLTIDVTVHDPAGANVTVTVTHTSVGVYDLQWVAAIPGTYVGHVAVADPTRVVEFTVNVSRPRIP